MVEQRRRGGAYPDTHLVPRRVKQGRFEALFSRERGAVAIRLPTAEEIESSTGQELRREVITPGQGLRR